MSDEWDRIESADRYASRLMRRIESTERARVEERADVSLSGPSQSWDRPATYGAPGFGSWNQGMVWQGAGGSATPETAMTLSAVFGCWRLINDAVTTLPIDFYTRAGGVRLPVDPPKYLTFNPPQQPKTVYLSQNVLSLLADGNAFVATPRDELGVPIDLWVLDPSVVTVKRKGRTKVYEIDGVEFSEWEIMQIQGMTLPGALRGVSPLTMAREVIDGGRKTQDFGRSFQTNGAVPPAVIEMQPGNDPKADKIRAERMAEVWHETHGGTSNAGRVGVLIGAQLKTIAVSPADAEWLESKRFVVSDVARFYGVPPHLLADASNSTSWGSGLAEQNTAFSQFALQPRTEVIEEGHNRLMYTHGAGNDFMKLNLDAKLRGSAGDRYAIYEIGERTRIDTINEIRALDDKPPVPWGDVPYDPTGGTSDEASPKEIAEMVQKVYLGVGKVLTTEEARDILNRAGAGLVGAGPTGGTP